MKQSKYIKGLTITVFVTLIAAFILYRAGYFDNYLYHESADLQTSPNGGTISQHSKDSLSFSKDSLPRKKVMFSSSKSAVVTDNIDFSADQKKKFGDTAKANQGELQIMSSSKSAVIFHPKPELQIVDSVLLKGAKKKP
ncbi:MAG: hypothetical protein JWP12_1316 [Bacteroidetes bacterium]|nr:hypothetical protein [Bacteroidota bacterium]